MHAAEVFALRRRGIISFAVETRSRTFGWCAGRIFPSASVLKAMLLVAYLRQPGVRRRPLTGSERALLGPMIRRSDNAAATTILGRVGPGQLRALARRAGMRHFTPVTGIWGNSRIDAADQVRYFFEIDHLIPARHRAYGMRLLASVTFRGRVRLPIRDLENASVGFRAGGHFIPGAVLADAGGDRILGLVGHVTGLMLHAVDIVRGVLGGGFDDILGEAAPGAHH